VGKAATSSESEDVMGGMCSAHEEMTSERTFNILAAKRIRHVLLKGPVHK